MGASCSHEWALFQKDARGRLGAAGDVPPAVGPGGHRDIRVVRFAVVTGLWGR
jgi:hypothetical protein